MGSIYVCGLDVHKDTVMVAVLEEDRQEPHFVKRMPNDLRKLRRLFDRLAKDGEPTIFVAKGIQLIEKRLRVL